MTTQINIDGKSITRVLAIGAVTLGVGAAAFFGGQTTRMDDTAVAAVKSNAVEQAIKATRAEDASILADKLAAQKTRSDRAQRKAVRKQRRITRRNERKRAERLSDTARNQGYSSGNSAGYGAGHSAGYSEGDSDGYSEGLEDAEPQQCSNDIDVPLPYC